MMTAHLAMFSFNELVTIFQIIVPLIMLAAGR